MNVILERYGCCHHISNTCFYVACGACDVLFHVAFIIERGRFFNRLRLVEVQICIAPILAISFCVVQGNA